MRSEVRPATKGRTVYEKESSVMNGRIPQRILSVVTISESTESHIPSKIKIVVAYIYVLSYATSVFMMAMYFCGISHIYHIFNNNT